MAKINDIAIEALVQDAGVRSHMAGEAQKVVDLARERAAVIMHRYPKVVEAIDFTIDDHGRAIVGIRDEGSISRYLAEKEGREHVWLEPAVAQVFGF
jgi:hypothetical protein